MKPAAKRGAGRPREFDMNAALERMLRLFWRGGFADTAMSDLVEASGVQKASLYAAFGDKQSIYEACLSRYSDNLVETFRLSLAHGRPDDRFGHLFRGVVARVAAHDRSGCFLCAAASDHAAPSLRSSNIARIALGRLERVFGLALDTVYRDTRQRDIAAKRMLSTYVGLQTLARAGYSTDALSVMAEDAVAGIPDGRSIR